MIWIIVLLAILILFVFIFYLILFLKFRKFINEDKDRIKMFSNCCLENLHEVANEPEVCDLDEHISVENMDNEDNNIIINADDF